MTRALLGCVTAALVANAFAADVREPAQNARQDPQTFRSGVDVVQLDVIVSDRSGRPVRGLTARDFAIRENDVPVAIASFREIVVPETTDIPAPPLDLSGAARGTNASPFDGRLIVLVIDDLGRKFDAGRLNRANRIALELIERLGPADQAAVVATSGSRVYQVDFTADKAKLAQPFRSHPLTESNTGDSALEVLTKIADRLAEVSNRRKVIAYIGEGELSKNPRASRTPDIKRVEIREFLAAAHRANVAFYGFSPRYANDLDTMVEHRTVAGADLQRSAEQTAVDDLRLLSDNTGGRAMTRTNMFGAAADVLFAESGSYYLIGYYARAPLDDTYRRIAVTTARDGLTVRSRPGYTATKARVQAGVRPIDRLLAAAIQSSGLEMRSVAVPVPSDGRPGSAVVLVTEVRASQIAGGDSFELGTIAVDMAGQIRATERQTSRVPSVHTDDPDRWVRIATAIRVPSGRYQLRVAGRRGDGKAEGSVFVEIEVPDFGGGLALGGLALSTPGLQGVANPDTIAPFLDAVPVAARDLPSGIPLQATLPVRVSARRAAAVNCAATLIGPDGAARAMGCQAQSVDVLSTAAGGRFQKLPRCRRCHRGTTGCASRCRRKARDPSGARSRFRFVERACYCDAVPGRRALRCLSPMAATSASSFLAS
ncbi:MAG TPA: VWA domain-containing protein [Vicinamibacterales bacterium]|nr:VWA domain-containing protein [Vicinamibacterales bacterium]